MYKLYNLMTNEVMEESAELAPLFVKLRYFQIIIKGKKEEIVAGRPHHLLDIMCSNKAHTLKEFKEVF